MDLASEYFSMEAKAFASALRNQAGAWVPTQPKTEEFFRCEMMPELLDGGDVDYWLSGKATTSPPSPITTLPTGAASTLFTPFENFSDPAIDFWNQVPAAANSLSLGHEASSLSLGREASFAVSSGSADSSLPALCSPYLPQKRTYVGVSRSRTAGKFEASLKMQGRKTYLGSFASEELAAKVYDLAILWLRQHSKRFRPTNFPAVDYMDVAPCLLSITSQDEMVAMLRQLAKSLNGAGGPADLHRALSSPF